AYQGRVMTSTTGSGDRPSFGWIGRAAITAGTPQPHMNVFGGEDRFWLGPEGGQFALFFRRGDPFDLDHWQVPEPSDWGSWEVTNQTPAEARFRKRMKLTSYSGTRMDIEVDADAGSIHPFRRPGPVRELDVGDSTRALSGRHRQQLQRRAASRRPGTPRSILRARDIVTGARSSPGTALHA